MMYGDANAQALVVLNASTDLVEEIVDWLLSRADEAGFTSYPVSGHGTDHAGLSAAEQVAGRERRQQFLVQVAGLDVDDFLADARRAFGTVSIRYWILPLVAAGHLDDGPPHGAQDNIGAPSASSEQRRRYIAEHREEMRMRAQEQGRPLEELEETERPE